MVCTFSNNEGSLFRSVEVNEDRLVPDEVVNFTHLLDVRDDLARVEGNLCLVGSLVVVQGHRADAHVRLGRLDPVVLQEG